MLTWISFCMCWSGLTLSYFCHCSNPVVTLFAVVISDQLVTPKPSSSVDTVWPMLMMAQIHFSGSDVGVFPQYYHWLRFEGKSAVLLCVPPQEGDTCFQSQWSLNLYFKKFWHLQSVASWSDSWFSLTVVSDGWCKNELHCTFSVQT